MSKWKYWQRFLFYFAILLTFYFIIASIEYDNEVNNNHVTMLAGLWSAFSTAILGGIAIWQNRRYKELSDLATMNTELIQREIKDLTKETMQAIEILKNIEMAKYYPLLSDIPMNYFGISKKTFVEDLLSDQYSIQSIMIKLVDENDLLLSREKIIEKYNVFIFILKNEGEKTIRDFGCHKIKINGETPNMMFAEKCDIGPGKYVAIAIFGFPEFKKGETFDLEMLFTLNNLIMEHYQCNVEILILHDDDHPYAHFMEFTTSKQEELKE